MNLKKFHIYLADLNLQFGTETGKIRPVVIVQTNILNRIHPSVVICPLTTNIKKEVEILRVHLPPHFTKLKKASDIMVDQIRAIDKRRIIKFVGSLTETQKQKLLESLQILIFD